MSEGGRGVQNIQQVLEPIKQVCNMTDNAVLKQQAVHQLYSKSTFCFYHASIHTESVTR